MLISRNKMELKKEIDFSGCCGLYCGLCPRFHSTSKSRCPGCRISEHHSWCKVYRCCVMKRDYVTCANCPEYSCEKLLSLVGTDEDSFMSHKSALPNLDRVKEAGLEIWLLEQEERRLLVEELLKDYNDGRSTSFYCTACALMPPDLIKKAKNELDNGEIAEDIKPRAKKLKTILQDMASISEIELRLRK